MAILIIIIVVAYIFYIFQYRITFKKTDPGVIINGVEWATCNIARRGFFTRKPEHRGKLFEGGGYDHYCPSGWRMPKVEDFDRLLDKDKVHIEKVNLAGTTGMRFVDKGTGCSMFLPAAGKKDNSCWRKLKNRDGYYWSDDRVNLHNDSPVDYFRYANKFMHFEVESSLSCSISYYQRFSAFQSLSIRAVRKK